MIDIMKLITETETNLRKYGDSPQARFEILGDFFGNVVKEIDERRKLIRQLDEDTVKNITFSCPMCGETMVFEAYESSEGWPPGTHGISYSFIHHYEKNKSWDEVQMEIDNPCEFRADYFVPDEKGDE